MNIPPQQQIEELWKKCEVPDRLKKHITAVTEVAIFLAEKLKEKGIPVNIELVRAGGLLHDLDKIMTLKQNNKHGKVTAKILEEEGFPEIARIAELHVFERTATEESTWEEKIVGYADKRCLENNIVSLQKRFEDGRERYPNVNVGLTEKSEQAWIEIEKEIFDLIGMKPEELQ